MNGKRIAATTVVALAMVGAAGGVAVATGDDDVSVTGAKADKAVAAALRATGEGTANSVERDGENGATWEVEVTREDGRTVDVRLDEGYGVVVIESDTEDSPEPAGE